MTQKDFLTKLADAGEDAIARLGGTPPINRMPGMNRMTGFANTTRDRLDELTKRVRGIDALEVRVAALEKRLDEMSGTTRSSTSKKKATSKAGKSSTAPKSSSGKTGGGSPG